LWKEIPNSKIELATLGSLIVFVLLGRGISTKLLEKGQSRAFALLLRFFRGNRDVGVEGELPKLRRHGLRIAAAVVIVVIGVRKSRICRATTLIVNETTTSAIRTSPGFGEVTADLRLTWDVEGQDEARARHGRIDIWYHSDKHQSHANFDNTQSCKDLADEVQPQHWLQPDGA